MKTLCQLIKRNVKLFFKDKGMFFTSLITPAILLVLYGTFLGNVYRDSFLSSLPEGFTLSDSLIDGLVGGELISALLAVSCVTVSFCSNFLMVYDRVSGTIRDLTIAPVRPATLSLSYYFANLISSLMICYAATVLCLLYVATVGWYLSLCDVLLLILDVTLLVLFGGALSSVINYFLHSQGQISAVGTVISSGYGFICGAYMPISSFDEWLQRVISCLPGTYGTALVRNHAMRGALAQMQDEGVPAEVIYGIEDALDCRLSFFVTSVPIGGMYAVIALTTVALLAVYVLLNLFGSRRKGV